MNRKSLWLCCGLVFLAFFSSCKAPGSGHLSGKADLMEADRSFSAVSEEKGIREAFISFADSAAVILKPNQMPIKGLEEVIQHYSSRPDTGLILVWEPIDGFVSESGELGYTYGTWKLTARGIVSEGSYATVWKRNREGNWKYILDTGNEGLGKKPATQP